MYIYALYLHCTLYMWINYMYFFTSADQNMCVHVQYTCMYTCIWTEIIILWKRVPLTNVPFLHLSLLQTYIAPQAALFGEIQGNPEILYNNLRVYGTILLLLMSVVVFVGVKFVSDNLYSEFTCFL